MDDLNQNQNQERGLGAMVGWIIIVIILIIGGIFVLGRRATQPPPSGEGVVTTEEEVSTLEEEVDVTLDEDINLDALETELEELEQAASEFKG